MIARNFYEGRANIFFPQIDYGGSNAGIIGSEFPFFNYLIFLVSEVFGYAHWYGRLINLVVSSVGVYFFYVLISNLTNRKIAFNASLILLSSIWFAFSRKIMPDTFSISLMMIGLYYGYKYLTTGGLNKAILYFVFATLGMLCKIPALSFMPLLLLLFFTPEIPAPRKSMIGLLSVYGIGIVLLWYFFWVPNLIDIYHNQLYFPRGLIEGLKEIIPLADGFFRNFYFNAFHSYVAFACFLGGVFWVFTRPDKMLKRGILLVTISFLAFVLKTGLVFPLHNYYIIPFVPVMALLAGIAIDKIPQKFQYAVLGLIALEGIMNQQHDFFIKENEGYKLGLETLSEHYTKPGDLIVINGGQSPQEMYFAHRKGWSVTNDQITPESLRLYKEAGADYLIINKRTFPDFAMNLPLVGSGNDYSVFSLNSGSQ
jgi:hypothetical protein